MQCETSGSRISKADFRLEELVIFDLVGRRVENRILGCTGDLSTIFDLNIISMLLREYNQLLYYAL
jgi:hypothetical protein